MFIISSLSPYSNEVRTTIDKAAAQPRTQPRLALHALLNPDSDDIVLLPQRITQDLGAVLRTHNVRSFALCGIPATVVLADDTSPPSYSPPTPADLNDDTPSQPRNDPAPVAGRYSPLRPRHPEVAAQQQSSSPSHSSRSPDREVRASRRRRRVSSPVIQGGETDPGPEAKRRRQEGTMNSNGETDALNGKSKPFSNGVAAQIRATSSKATNGTSKGPYTNGSASTNGHSPASKSRSSAYLGHSREEVSRLIIQALQDLGYTSSAAQLVQESGFELEAPVVAAFRQAVVQGSWVLAESLLFGGPASPMLDTENGERNGEESHGLSLAAHAQPSLMRFWLRQQKFLELLEARETHNALKVLRTELTPLNQDHDKLHFLSR